MNIQIQQSGKWGEPVWLFLGSIHRNYFRTTADKGEALSADYLSIVRDMFPDVTFREV